MLSFLYKACVFIKKQWELRVCMPALRKQFSKCGKGVVIDSGSRIAGKKNISFGDDVYIGPQAMIYSTNAKLIFGSHISAGPRLTVITGDHRIDVIGEYMKN